MSVQFTRKRSGRQIFQEIFRNGCLRVVLLLNAWTPEGVCALWKQARDPPGIRPRAMFAAGSGRRPSEGIS